MPLFSAMALGASSALGALRLWARREYDKAHANDGKEDSRYTEEQLAKLQDSWARTDPLRNIQPWQTELAAAMNEAAQGHAPQDKVWPVQPGSEKHKTQGCRVRYPFDPTGRVGLAIEPTGGPLDPLHWALVWWPGDGCWEIWWMPKAAIFSTTVRKGAAINYTDPVTGIEWSPQVDAWYQADVLAFGFAEMDANPRLYPLGDCIRVFAGRTEDTNTPAAPASMRMDYNHAKCSRVTT